MTNNVRTAINDPKLDKILQVKIYKILNNFETKSSGIELQSQKNVGSSENFDVDYNLDG